MKKTVLLLGMTLTAALVFAAGVLAAGRLFGGATQGSGPECAIVLTSNTSNSSTTDDYSGVAFTPASGTTLANITNLSADFQVTQGDCGGGSPRFSIATASGNIFVYLGPTPNFTGCGAGRQQTGNLTQLTDARVDTSQVGGTFYDTWQNAVATYGALPVSEVDLVVDAGWATGGVQTVKVYSVQVNDDVAGCIGPPTTKDQCKNGGWQTFNVPRAFKNQGDCIQFVNTGK
ncbi:MAG: hypothetical protein KIT87_14475 [Anaerolineae bacterium]|nr:hypothetical protein [Anaerolineae bacterium]